MKSITGIKRFLGILFFASLFLVACKENEIYPIVPSIVFKDAYVLFDQNNMDSLIVLVFSYKDGDGDIGLDGGDTLPPYNPDTLGYNHSILNRFYNNVWIDYYEKRNSIYTKPLIPSTSDTVYKDVRVGNLTPQGSHKAIRGDIQVQFFPSSYPLRADTIKLKARLIDRALHISNEVESPDLYLVR